MAKYNAGKLYNTGELYGPATQYLLGVGNIAGAEVWGTPQVHPGPVSVSGAGNIPATDAFGTPWFFRIPKRLAVGINIRRLKVNPDG